MSPDHKLVYMANQIGKFFTSQGEETAVAAITDHLVKFWDPRMRTAIIAYLDSGGAGLEPLVLKAVAALPRVGPAERSGSPPAPAGRA